jgi:hypothetical protein
MATDAKQESARAIDHMSSAGGREAQEILRRAFELLDAMEKTQHEKVISLARRLVPGLTAEDIRNPHDFPDLDDPDWHFEDGQLAGIQAVRFALHALARDLEGHGAKEGD